MTKRLLVLLHGLGGSPEKTWAKFPELLKQDAQLSALYFDIDNTQYETSALKPSVPSLSEIAQGLYLRLAARVETEEIDEVAFIAHSQGGILARRLICDWMGQSAKTSTKAPIFRLLTFATPHWGAYSEHASKAMSLGNAALSTVANMIGVPVDTKLKPNDQVAELTYDAASILQLNKDWVQHDLAQKVWVRYVAAKDDAIVRQTSAMGANFDHGYIALRDQMQGAKSEFGASLYGL